MASQNEICKICIADGGDCCLGCGQVCDCEQCKDFKHIMDDLNSDLYDGDSWL